jgi:Cd2+/Zn2+-exporting ATPase
MEMRLNGKSVKARKKNSGCSCGACAGQTPEDESFVTKEASADTSSRLKKRIRAAVFGLGAALFAAALIFDFAQPVNFIVFTASYLFIGGDILFRALKNISRGQVFDENFLMSLATAGAFAIGEYPEGVAVMIFYQVGEYFQNLAVTRSRRSISSLMDIRPDFANVRRDGQTLRVNPADVTIGEIIVVKPGEKIPLDGVLVSGVSALDTSALTGESLPRDVGQGDEVLSGSINKTGLIEIKVTKAFGESTVSRILNLVQNAGSKKAPVENFITSFARYYTPAVVFAAVILAVIPPLVLSGASFSGWLHRALVFLVVSCPCALVISIPLSFFGGIGGASKNGILVKGGNYLEALNKVDTVVFDKTGTLTRGVFSVTEIVCAPDTGASLAVGRDDLLRCAAYAESGSNHPIALSILKAWGKEIDSGRIEEFEEIAGKGTRIKIDGKTVLAGKGRLLSDRNIAYTKAESAGTIVYIAVDGVYAGYITIADELKGDSGRTIEGLKKAGVRRTVMLTGDSSAVAEKIGAELGIDKVCSELLPQEKVEELEKLEKEKSGRGKLVFVGDGINDAPVLARSDVGVAMGGVGSDAAIEAADIVLMTDEPSRLITAIRIARRTHRIVWQNIIFALGVKGIILIFGALGIATMWAAVFGDVGVALIATLNSLRTLRIKDVQL